MKAFEYILSKQVIWARNNKISLIGSKRTHGRPAYTLKLEDNLFGPLEQSVREDFERGDGGELSGNPSKMCAIHSSSALGVNIFQYWLKINQIPTISAACGFCSKNNNISHDIKFEQKFPIDEEFKHSPNIDVVIKNTDESKFRVFAIECKFSEAYSSQGHAGLKQKYIKLKEIWDGMPHLYNFAKSISPDDHKFYHLHPAQLVKHILGLTKTYGKGGYRLLYLWYDCLGHEGAKHRDEINEFAAILEKDGINFHALSYQELIIRLSTQCLNSHRNYINYISSRYL